MPSGTPCWGKQRCERCGREFWEYYSRPEPQAFTLEQFEERFIVDDEATKQIREKNPLPPLSAIDEAILDEFWSRFFNLIEDDPINGTGAGTPNGILNRDYL